MASMSQDCFICGKPTVVFYDFLVVEETTASSRKGVYTTTTNTQKLSGIVRITLCADCMKDSLNRQIALATNKNGKPKLLEGKKVAELRRFEDEIDRGIY